VAAPIRDARRTPFGVSRTALRSHTPPGGCGGRAGCVTARLGVCGRRVRGRGVAWAAAEDL